MRDRSSPLSAGEIAELDWDKMDGLLPAIVQDRGSGRVLMVGYMNREALEATLASRLATFFSRSKGRLWQKGETSGNVLNVEAVFADCDNDALLVVADAQGPTCHRGSSSCFGEQESLGPGWLSDLRRIVKERARSGDETSYTRRLLAQGTGRLAQKVGEEGVEVALAAVSRSSAECAEELADLIYHVTVLMESLDIGWDQVIDVLKQRHMLATSRTASS
jgi:phosphoribosyl-ATP pyrophosphohydrolase/phosphoribosyl-AMP cyclohydrolase